MQTSRSEFIQIRDHQYHCRHWGSSTAPAIFMFHGWMDVSASFQFVVDSLKKDWHVIAPDLRGFGLTTGPKTDSYWYPDYLADLDALLLHYSPDRPVNLLGHSMGANIVTSYAGIRPERIAKLMVLENVALPAAKPSDAPVRFRQWLDELRVKPKLQTYASVVEVAKRLQKTNSRLKDERALFLAQHWSRENAEGQWEILGDPAHKIVSPILYRVDEILACWEAISAPILWVEAADTEIWNLIGGKEKGRPETERRLTHLKGIRREMVRDAGHMVHHDQPQILAEFIDDFLS